MGLQYLVQKSNPTLWNRVWVPHSLDDESWQGLEGNFLTHQYMVALSAWAQDQREAAWYVA